MNRDDCPAARSNGRLYLIEIDIVSARVNVNEHRRRSDFDDHIRCSDPRIWCRDHLVARPDTGNPQCYFHRAGARVVGTDRSSAKIGGQVRFEGLYL